MASIVFSRVTAIWAGLAAASLLSFETAVLGNQLVGHVLILLIAFAKATAVGREFMELRHAPRWLLWLFQSWAIATCVILIILFTAPPTAF